MFTFMLQHYVASTVLALKPFTNLIEGADSRRLVGLGAMLVDVCGNKKCTFNNVTNQGRVWTKGAGC